MPGGQANSLGTVKMLWIGRSAAKLLSNGEGSETKWWWADARHQLKIESVPVARRPQKEESQDLEFGDGVCVTETWIKRTSGKGLALRVGSRGLHSETTGCWVPAECLRVQGGGPRASGGRV